jgi:hypothetical protein
LLDGQPLVLDPATTGYDHEGYAATFVLPDPSSWDTHTTCPPGTRSTVTVTDQQTTWSATVPDLFANDLHPVAAMVANQPDTLAWPSAASEEPRSTIYFACIEVGQHDAACVEGDFSDPGIAIAQEYVHVDIAANAGDPFTAWGRREVYSVITGGDAPMFDTQVFDRVTGSFE